MSDTHAMAQLRSDLLTAMYTKFPLPLSRTVLAKECRSRFLTRDKDWYDDAVNEQVKVLQQASLVRPSNGGFTLTERGRQDRQQAQRFITTNNPPPPDAA
jgi:hypothetical protein